MEKNSIQFLQSGLIEIVEGSGTPKFPYHTHNSFLIGVIKEGEAHLTIEKKEYFLSEGMTYLVPSNIGMSINPVTPYSYLTICLRGELKEQIEQYNIDNYVLQFIGDKISLLCNQFKSDRKEASFLNALIKTLNLQKIEQKVISDKRSSPIVEEAVNYINEQICID